MSERTDAVKLANRVLDKPYIDPDGDICMLARQFLRMCSTALYFARHISECPGQWGGRCVCGLSDLKRDLEDIDGESKTAG